MKVEYIIGLIIFVLISVGLGVLFLYPSSETDPKLKELKEKTQPYIEIVKPAGFVNTENITIGEHIGKKIILVDFLTYSCINCQRTFPYLNAWYKKYKDAGFIIIGIHTPEFAFEKNIDNVRKAMKQFGIMHPIVLDNDYATWRAYGNNYWPRKYLINIHGNIIYDHIGEGAYAETEKKIQEALEERKIVLGLSEDINKDISNPSDVVSINNFKSKIKSPEIYFGARRNERLGNGDVGRTGTQNLSKPSDIKTNVLYLDGEWDIQDEFVENQNTQAKIVFRYQAKDVYFVAGADQDAKINILKDGKFINELIIKEHGLYHIIQDSEHGEHTLEIIIKNSGLRVFTFTFG